MIPVQSALTRLSTRVWFEGFEVGRIGPGANGAAGFLYDPRWVAARGGFALSLTMPLRAEPFGPEIIETWLANLLPEGANLVAASRLIGLSSLDLSGLLRALGADAAGAFTFGTGNDRAGWIYEPLAEFIARREGNGAEGATALGRFLGDLAAHPFFAGEEGARFTLAGDQPKVALAVIDPDGAPVLGLPGAHDRLAVARNGAPTTVIVKPDTGRRPGGVENAAYCLELARRIGLDAVDWQILDTGGKPALMLARFDRGFNRAGGIRRMHQEDFAQALGLPPERKFGRDDPRGADLSALISVGRRLGDPRDRLGLLDYLIFNILIANCDAHAKNYALLLGGEPRLAPLYDPACSLLWDSADAYLAQPIAGGPRRPGVIAGRHWDWIAAEIGGSPRELRRRVAELAEAMARERGAARDTVAGAPGARSAPLDDVAELIATNARGILARMEQ